MNKTFALIYDFDGTLSPLSMQEYTILPEIGMTGEEFWGIVDAEKKRVKGDPTLTYMRVLLDICRERGYKMTRDKLVASGKNIRYFEGVEGFFGRVNGIIKQVSPDIEVKHYVLSSGLKELIEGCSIARNFTNIFACEYYYGQDGEAKFPKFCINSTDKTQYIFRINKGVEDQLYGPHAYMAPEDRPVPLSNMIYIGDGMTDVPCMKIIRQGGGTALSVFNPQDEFSVNMSKRLVAEHRVDEAVEADYGVKSGIERAVVGAIKEKYTASAIFSGVSAEMPCPQFTARNKRKITAG